MNIIITSVYGWSDKTVLIRPCPKMLLCCRRNRVENHGVIVDLHLTFTHHMCTDQIVARAFTRANLIQKCVVSTRSTASLTRVSMSDLYLSIVSY